MSDQRIVLIGRSGFVGSNLLKYLAGHDIVAPAETEADLTKPDSLRPFIESGSIVVNCAGYANATDTTERGRALFQAINVDGLRNLAEVCAEVGAAQLVHISSVAAMGRWHQEGVTEEMLRPVSSPYAESKLAGEKLLLEYSDKLNITTLRPTSVFGEGRGLARTLCQVVSKGTVPLPGGGQAKIPFTYIGNVARGVEAVLGNSNCFGRTFIVGDENSYALREVIEGLAEAMGVHVRIVPIPTVMARAGAACLETLAAVRGSAPLLDRGRLDTLTRSVSYSIAALRETAGYEPAFDLRESLGRIAAWYQESRRHGQ